MFIEKVNLGELSCHAYLGLTQPEVYKLSVLLFKLKCCVLYVILLSVVQESMKPDPILRGKGAA